MSILPGKKGLTRLQSSCLPNYRKIWSEIQALLDFSFPSIHYSLLPFSLPSSPTGPRLVRVCEASVWWAAGLCRLRVDRALLAAALLKANSRDGEGGCWSDLWCDCTFTALYPMQCTWVFWEQLPVVGLIKQLFGNAPRAEGWFPVSAEPCVELCRHRWRFERCRRRVLRKRGPAEKCSADVCSPLWTCSLAGCGLQLVGHLGEIAEIADELAGPTGVTLKDREFGFKVWWIWTPRAAPGDLLWNGSS